MTTFDDAGNFMDGIDDFTDLLAEADGYGGCALPFLDDGYLKLGTPSWATADEVNDIVSDNSSDSGVSSISVKQEPYSPGSLVSPPSSVYSDASSQDAICNHLLGDAFMYVEEHRDLLPFLSHDSSSSPPLSPYGDTSPSNVVVSRLPIELDMCLSPSFVNLGKQQLGVQQSSAVSSSSPPNCVSLVSDARICQVLQSKVKIQPRPERTSSVTLAQSPAATPMAEVASPAAMVHTKPLVVSAEDFALLTAQGMLKFHSPLPSVSSSASVVCCQPSGLAGSPAVTVARVGGGAALAVSTASGVKRPLPTVVTVGSLSDDGDDCKAYKKQQRMIKNRESASLSRKRRKEYMSSLEQMLQQCSSENEALKQENEGLRRRVDSLQTENDRLKSSLPLNKKATTTCLMTFAICAVVKIAFFSQSQMGAMEVLPPLSSKAALMSGIDSLTPDTSVHHGRSLLTFNERQWGDGDSNVVGGKKGGSGSNVSGNASTSPSERGSMELMVVGSKDDGSRLCPTRATYYNGTESQRLANELSGWALRSKIAAKKTKKQPTTFASARRSGAASSVPQWSKHASHSDSVPTLRGSRPLSSQYAMQIYHSHDSVPHKFFDAIQRRNDTFYVISFRMDHWLLPATAHNKTTRPKMVLVVPALPLNESAQGGSGAGSNSVTMLQIECEVTDTRFLRIDQSMIPRHAASASEDFDATDVSHKAQAAKIGSMKVAASP